MPINASGQLLTILYTTLAAIHITMPKHQFISQLVPEEVMKGLQIWASPITMGCLIQLVLNIQDNGQVMDEIWVTKGF
uniref:Uncharacterized protein n=1 Tax=Acrobeloides nanus TaxID=290746 RepID=A0A914DAZ3_9BILA